MFTGGQGQAAAVFTTKCCSCAVLPCFVHMQPRVLPCSASGVVLTSNIASPHAFVPCMAHTIFAVHRTCTALLQVRQQQRELIRLWIQLARLEHGSEKGFPEAQARLATGGWQRSGAKKSARVDALRVMGRKQGSTD